MQKVMWVQATSTENIHNTNQNHHQVSHNCSISQSRNCFSHVTVEFNLYGNQIPMALKNSHSRHSIIIRYWLSRSSDSSSQLRNLPPIFEWKKTLRRHLSLLNNLSLVSPLHKAYSKNGESSFPVEAPFPMDSLGRITSLQQAWRTHLCFTHWGPQTQMHISLSWIKLMMLLYVLHHCKMCRWSGGSGGKLSATTDT